MPSPSTAPDRRRSPRRTAIKALAAATSSLAMAAVLLTTPTATAATPNPVTPGNFTGRGFDQCDAPSQRAMDAWLAHSPFRAVGIYISGNSRFCREQPNLTPTWVRTQLAKGWRLLPITLGPQASCLDRFPRYGAHIDPTIDPNPAGNYAAARRQGILEGRKAIYAARDLGIVPGSTIFYDLEGFPMNSAHCRSSALWFLSAWTDTMHNSGYASGVYSSAGSGIVLLDWARRHKPAGYTDPDQLWIARWDGKANTSTTYISDEGWKGQRVKQYLGGHKERHGGVTINIDSNWLDVRSPKLPGRPAPSDPPSPEPDEPRATTGTYDPKCTRDSINAPNYGITRSTHNEHLIVALQCLLKQQGRYNREVTGTWNRWTTAALNEFQGTVRHARRAYASRNDWIAALSRGGTPTLRLGSRGPDVIRVQRAMNAATLHMLEINGVYDAETRRAVRRYQHKIFGKGYGNVGLATWRVLHRGRL